MSFADGAQQDSAGKTVTCFTALHQMSSCFNLSCFIWTTKTSTGVN